MKVNRIYCFSANRICHHDDYYLLVNKIRTSFNVKKRGEKLRILLGKAPILFFDIDSSDLIYFPIILIRGLWGGNGLAISVRTEYLLEKRTIIQFLFNRNRLIFVKSLVKRMIFFLLKKYSSTTILSIHKNHEQRKRMEPFVNDFIQDPQLWDLEFLKLKSIKPIELDGYESAKSGPVILIAGRFDEQRSKSELLQFLSKNPNFNFIIAGIIESNDNQILNRYSNCFILNRFLSNEELIYLYEYCAIIYCYYTNDRPSGFFGRALQYNKPIIVRKNKFLHQAYNDYEKLIPVDSLIDLSSFNFDSIEVQGSINHKFNDSIVFSKYLMDL